MPELPEVEIVTRNLTQILQPPIQIEAWIFMRKDLRFNIPQKELLSLVGKPILSIQRRAKYILFEFESDYIISHLGMTGAWRVEPKNGVLRKHDHLCFQFNSNNLLVYEDPRRFGFIEVCKKNEILKRFAETGVEPLEVTTDFNELTKTFKKLEAPIKNALMNQKLIVGVGNIYASEILFRTQLSPLKKSSKVSLEQYQKIWQWTKTILAEAIDRGGSTIENYKNSYGQAGSFQNQFQVYGRKGEPCYVCGNLIKAKNLAGRNTFWCSACQK